MSTYADQRAHDVAWMTAAERAEHDQRLAALDRTVRAHSMPGHPTLDQRRELCAAKVTLNGQPATISGAMRDFAVVRDIKTGLGAEWAWVTVARIVANGGRFRS